ncbi:STAS-like domain-containing protein [Acidovorax radicis]|uniref:STAS-like domain-containing protein n=1 Tax=Acidovorax radicis TaxID=758826 RepID=UPI00023766C4|nr:STAS-like domain-containing protein [Acidovorax radicis]
MTSRTISIANDFSRTPAGRFVTDGPFSGERFRDELLVPALRENDKVVVDLTGVFGFGSSFLDEAFGGLVRKKIITSAALGSKFEIVSPLRSYREKVEKYIREARPE